MGEHGGLKYAPTDKHKPGGWGTEMDLDNKTAQDVLNSSVQGGRQRYGVYDGKVYEFQPDNIGGWHGYPIPGNQAPTEVLRSFRDEGTISRSEYNKLIKGK
jgi:filamentous hemagglutinin